MKKEVSIQLLIAAEDVCFPGQSSTFSVKTTAEGDNYIIWIESKKNRRQWIGTFDNLSKCNNDEGFQIPSNVILDGISSSLSNLSSGINSDPIDSSKSQLGLEEVDSNMILTLKIQLFSTFVSYSFILHAVEIDEVELLKMQCNDLGETIEEMNDAFERLQDEMKKKSDQIERLQDEMIRKSDEMNKKLDAFIFRDVKSLKTFGYSASQMKKAGFSMNELHSAWSSDELMTERLAFSPSLTLEIRHGSCSLDRSGKSVT